MTWTYTPPTSSADSRNVVRLMVGDTDSTNPLIDDEEIDYVLTEQTVLSYAAAACAEMIAAKQSILADLEIGETAVKHAQKARAFERLAERLRRGGPGNLPGGDGSATKAPQVFAGGASKADIESFYDNDDNVKPSFAVGQDDFNDYVPDDPVEGR